MKAVLSILFVLFISIQSYAQYSSPESITYDSIGQRYLVSNTTSQKIVQRSRAGVVTDFVTVGGGIHGVTVFNNRVYVCNGTRIRGYDLSNASEVFNVQIVGSTFLNDLSIDNTGIMYISDFSTRRIYKLNTNNEQYWIYVANTTNIPNGVYVDSPRNRLLICCWGAAAPVRAVNFADSSITTLVTTAFSNCDGISLDRNDNVYVSAWSAQSVVRYDINFTNPPVTVASGLSNPADIYVNKRTDTLAVPNAGNSTVSFHLLSIPSGVNPISSVNPNSFELHQNFPNPFNPSTLIKFSIGKTSFIAVKVHDVLGKEIATLVNAKQNAGSYSVKFESSNLSGEIYFYSLFIDGILSDAKKMILLK